MSDESVRRDLHGFAIELRKLAHTMPAGHEDRLIHLSDRMVEQSLRRSASQHCITVHRLSDPSIHGVVGNPARL